MIMVQGWTPWTLSTPAGNPSPLTGKPILYVTCGNVDRDRVGFRGQGWTMSTRPPLSGMSAVYVPPIADLYDRHDQRGVLDRVNDPVVAESDAPQVAGVGEFGAAVRLRVAPARLNGMHLKQPINVVGPFNIEHNAHTGVSSIVEDEQKDLVEMARRCAGTGLSASDAAGVLFEAEAPNKGQVAKGRRRLQALERKGLLVCREPEVAGRGHEARWYPAARLSDVPQEHQR